jgi:hypothetical protein
MLITSSKAGGLIGNRQSDFKGCLDDCLDFGLLKSSAQTAPIADLPSSWFLM